MQEARPDDGRRKTDQIQGRASLTGQEGGQVTGHRGILGIGQADLGQGAARTRRWSAGCRHVREETLDQGLGHVIPGQFGANGTADQTRTATWHHDRDGAEIRVAEQGFLGLTTAMGQGLELPAIQFHPIGLEFGTHQVGQRQIHVVAAQQDVVADRDAGQLQGALILGDRDQRQVGGTATDIDHQDDVPDPDLAAPITVAIVDPAVERRLRLLQQDQVDDADSPRRLGRQFTGGRVEGRGNRDRDLLDFQGILGVAEVPGFAQVPQIVNTGLKGRDLGYLVRSTVREDRGAAIQIRMTEPALSAGDQPDRGRGTLDARQFAANPARIARPGQRQVGRPELVRVRQIKE